MDWILFGGKGKENTVWRVKTQRMMEESLKNAKAEWFGKRNGYLTKRKSKTYFAYVIRIPCASFRSILLQELTSFVSTKQMRVAVEC